MSLAVTKSAGKKKKTHVMLLEENNQQPCDHEIVKEVDFINKQACQRH